jgi:RNA polymerase sigma-70 factor (ECF subfamily)
MIDPTPLSPDSGPAGGPGPTDAADDLERLFVDHGPRLRRMVGARARDADAADDLCQEAFLRLFLELRAGRAPRSVPAWLHQVAHNLLVSEVRHRRVVQAALPHAPEPAADPTATAVLDRERWTETMDALASLSPAERDVIARATAGAPAARVASELGTTTLTARMRLHRSRRHLRTLMAARGAPAD